jgi:hypothetical protein
MKLVDYAIAEYIADQNYSAAVQVLSSYFNLQVPKYIKVTVYHQLGQIEPTIYIYHDRMTYRWNSSGGFCGFASQALACPFSNVYLPKFPI